MESSKDIPNPYGKVGEEVIESLGRIEKFQPGYPKRIVVDVTKYRHGDAMQRYFDWIYETACMMHEIEMEPVQASLL